MLLAGLGLQFGLRHLSPTIDPKPTSRSPCLSPGDVYFKQILIAMANPPLLFWEGLRLHPWQVAPQKRTRPTHSTACFGRGRRMLDSTLPVLLLGQLVYWVCISSLSRNCQRRLRPPYAVEKKKSMGYCYCDLG